MTPTATSAPDLAHKPLQSSGMAPTLPNVLLQAGDAGSPLHQTASQEEGVSEGPDGMSVTTSDGRGAILLHPVRQMSKVTVQLSTHSFAPAVPNCRVFFHFKNGLLIASQFRVSSSPSKRGHRHRHRPVLLYRTFRSDDRTADRNTQPAVIATGSQCSSLM